MKQCAIQETGPSQPATQSLLSRGNYSRGPFGGGQGVAVASMDDDDVLARLDSILDDPESPGHRHLPPLGFAYCREQDRVLVIAWRDASVPRQLRRTALANLQVTFMDPLRPCTQTTSTT